jgi:hypothetical protein
MSVLIAGLPRHIRGWRARGEADREGEAVASSDEALSEVQPEVFSLHWEGPPLAQLPAEPAFPGSEAERRAALAAERERELREIRRSEQGRVIWDQVRAEALRRGDEKVWERKLHAYGWVKLQREGSAADYARRFGANHATVRTWIADVAKLAYEVGYRLHEDRLLLVGDAPAELDRLRTLVNADPGSPEAWQALREVEDEFRGRDAYFHLNEGHVLRAHGRLRHSDASLREGLTIAEARRTRALLWNARGQTFWDCGPDSDWPLDHPLEHARRAFRRAAAVDPTSYFPFVNLAQLAVDAGDLRRAEYWVGELGSARKQMQSEMKTDLARYLRDAEWSGMVERTRWWQSGPARWIREAARAGSLALAAALLGGLLWSMPASADPAPEDLESVTHVEHRGAKSDRRGGAGGN